MVLVRSKKKEDTKRVKEKVQRILDPTKLKIVIQKFREGKSGVLIEYGKELEIVKIINEVDMNEEWNEEFEVRRPMKINLKIIIYRVEDTYDEECINKLKEHNQESERGNVKHEYIMNTRNGKQWILSLDPLSFTKLMINGKTNWGRRIYSIKEYIRPVPTCHSF